MGKFRNMSLRSDFAIKYPGPMDSINVKIVGKDEGSMLMIKLRPDLVRSQHILFFTPSGSKALGLKMQLVGETINGRCSQGIALPA